MSTAVGIQNAFNVEYTHMRRSLVPRLLENIANNTKYAEKLSMYEIGNVYSKKAVSSMHYTEKSPLTNGVGDISNDTQPNVCI
jgi:phenylalanyl-tRNA synthetase beta subunit